jgi:purine-binding chemotaxis protein CheW
MRALATQSNSELAYLGVGDKEYVTMTIGDQLFGVNVTDIRDVFALKSLTPVPGAKPEVAGVLNLRGRIVTAIDARRKLGLPPRPEGYAGMMAVGVEYEGEAYGILVDHVGDVLRIGEGELVPNPANMQPHWKTISQGVYRLEGKLMITFNVETFLSSTTTFEQGH